MICSTGDIMGLRHEGEGGWTRGGLRERSCGGVSGMTLMLFGTMLDTTWLRGRPARRGGVACDGGGGTDARVLAAVEEEEVMMGELRWSRLPCIAAGTVLKRSPEERPGG